MASVNPPRIFFTVLVEKCRKTAFTLQTFEAFEYPSDGPRILRQCLYESVNDLISRVEGFRNKSQSPDIPAYQLQEIELESSYISEYIDNYITELFIPMLRDASIDKIPAELVSPLEEISLSLFPGCMLLIQAIPNLNYRFMDIAPKVLSLFQNLDLEELLSKNNFPNKLFVLQLPIDSAFGILPHCILGHELGHALWIQEGIDRILLPLINIEQKDLTKIVDSTLKALDKTDDLPHSSDIQIPLEQSRGFLQMALKARLITYCTRWIKELFCDIIGAGLFGPSFICAMGAFLLTFEDIDSPSEYPPGRLRLKITLRSILRSDPGFGYRKLNSMDFNQILSPMLRQWQQLLVAKSPQFDDPVFKLVMQTVVKETVIKEMIGKAKNTIENNRLKPGDFSKQVPYLARRINSMLPPNEYATEANNGFHPANVQSIFNAAWLCYMQELDQLSKKLPMSNEWEVRKIFYGLISLGVELNDIKGTWPQKRRAIDECLKRP